METKMDIKMAIRSANASATSRGKPVLIVWHKKAKEWQFYSNWTKLSDCDPEFLCLGLGLIPVPLSETAEQVFISLIRSEA